MLGKTVEKIPEIFKKKVYYICNRCSKTTHQGDEAIVSIMFENDGDPLANL